MLNTSGSAAGWSRSCSDSTWALSPVPERAVAAMKHVGRIDLGPSILAHQAGHTHPTRWRAWVPLVGISVASLVVGLSGGKRTAREPAIDLATRRVDVEAAQDRATAWRPAAPEVAVDKPFAVPAQASPGGNVLRIMGPPMVIEVRVPKAKGHVAKK
jgi:hypothetical protein